MYTKNPVKVPTDCQNPTDEVDLSNAELFAVDSVGVYIPQFFAQSVRRECVTGVSDEDYKVLEEGPEHEHYWDAWSDVCDNAKINHPVHGPCHLYQDGDLWIVPDEKEEPGTKVVLGHTFKPFSENDWHGFAGADEGSYICHITDGNTTLILSPDGKTVSEFVWSEPTDENPNGAVCHDWTRGARLMCWLSPVRGSS